MKHPNFSTLSMLRRTRDRLYDLDEGPEDGPYDAMTMVARDYASWLDGRWKPTPERAREVLGEHFAVAIARAEALGLQYLAGAIEEMKAAICEE